MSEPVCRYGNECSDTGVDEFCQGCINLVQPEQHVDSELTTLRARVAELLSTLDLADCTQRDGGDVRHCGESRCWRCRAESAERRVVELEAKLALAIAVGDETADLRKAAESRALAAEERVKRLEGALRGAVELIEQTEWTAFSVNDAKKLQAARAALAVGRDTTQKGQNDQT